ncbi:proline racemase family protein [Vibrio parahaemolyticus]|nr:proline racemase family protein [Vibrio parahaemolyticus]
MNEQYYDAVLNIKTVGEQKGFNKSMHYHRYEPTPYSGLDELLNQYEIKRSDRVVDFGCGKGRLNFYMHHKCGASAVGIEMNEEFVHESIVGSLFKGCVINTTNVANMEAVVTKITGSAWLMGMHRFFYNEKDPLKEGFLLIPPMEHETEDVK